MNKRIGTFAYRATLVLLTLILLFLCTSALAAEGDYTKTNSTKRIAVSTKSSSNSDKCYIKKEPFEAAATVRVISKGAIIYLSGTAVNKYDNTWYITEDGYFVYSGDVEIKVGNASISIKNNTKGISTFKKSSYQYTKPYSASNKFSAAKGDTVLVVQKVTNSYGNTWYKTSDGKYVYSGDITTPAEYITLNSQEWLGVSTKNKTGSDQCYVKTNPFEDSTTVKTIAKNDYITIAGKVKNKYGNVWYKTNDGYFVYSDDLKLVEYLKTSSTKGIAVSTKKTTSSDKCYIKKEPFENSTTIRTVDKDVVIYLSGVVVNKYLNKWYITEDGYYVYSDDVNVKVNNASITVIESKQLIATTKKSTYLYSKPYDASTKKSIAKGNSVIIVQKVNNSYGNTWYKTSDGMYVYSGNISTPAEYIVINNQEWLGVSKKNKTDSDACFIKTAPIENATTVKTVAKDDFVSIESKIMNKYGEVWYKTNEGYFVDSDDIKLVDYLKTSSTRKIAVSSKQSTSSDICYIKEQPFENSSTIRTVNKGSVIYLSGTVVNKYANKWYITEDGYYVYSGDVSIKVSNASISVVESKQGVALTKKATYLYSRPYDASTKSSIAKGSTVIVVQKVKNSYGNIWYKTKDGKYIYSGNISTPTEYVVVDSTKRLGKSIRYNNSSNVCELRREPFDSAAKITNVEKGVVLFIDAKIVNKYGSVWYRTTNGDQFVYSGDITFVDYVNVSCNVSIGVSIRSRNDSNLCYQKATPFDSGKTIWIMDKGDAINITGAVINKYHNLWYVTGEGYYVYSGDLKTFE